MHAGKVKTFLGWVLEKSERILLHVPNDLAVTPLLNRPAVGRQCQGHMVAVVVYFIFGTVFVKQIKKVR
jgi:hypothetical protein